jgi:hypothetical protein
MFWSSSEIPKKDRQMATYVSLFLLVLTLSLPVITKYISMAEDLNKLRITLRCGIEITLTQSSNTIGKQLKNLPTYYHLWEFKVNKTRAFPVLESYAWALMQLTPKASREPELCKNFSLGIFASFFLNLTFKPTLLHPLHKEKPALPPSQHSRKNSNWMRRTQVRRRTWQKKNLRRKMERRRQKRKKVMQRKKRKKTTLPPNQKTISPKW